jgi:hypothetical protein
MATKVNTFLVTACLLSAVDAAAITGSEWRQLSPAAQQYYVIGVLDGWDNLGTITLLAEQKSPVGIGYRNTHLPAIRRPVLEPRAVQQHQTPLEHLAPNTSTPQYAQPVC